MRKENAKSSPAIDATEGAGDGSFFRRWSRRKRRARRGEAEEPPAEAPAESGQTATQDATGEPERVLSDEDMPPLESLDENSDFSPFMSPGVSESLRNLALRKMFLSSKYNFTDGLDDYAEDFTKFAPLGDVITADMRHQMEMQAEKARQKLEEEARAAVEDAPADDAAETRAAAEETSAGDAPEDDTGAAAGSEPERGTPGDAASDEDGSRNA